MRDYLRKRQHLLLLIAALSLILLALCGEAYAKYVRTEEITGQLTVHADIGTISVQEHVALRQADGSYILGEALADKGNTYTLIPGLDVPKDPQVVIEKDSTLTVYVYLEVVDGNPSGSGITYSLESHWTQLKGVTGKNHGKVYYYKVTEACTLNILQDKMIYVSQKLDKNMGNWKLTFYASMKQAVGEKTAAEVYQDSTNY